VTTTAADAAFPVALAADVIVFAVYDPLFSVDGSGISATCEQEKRRGTRCDP
jgi:hypothetical protein